MDLSEKQIYDESETGSEYSDDSHDDPNFDAVEEARSTFSNLSLKKKTNTRVSIDVANEIEDELSDVIEMVMPELNEEDQKSYETIQKIIEGDQVERLKVDQCKIYLRKHGLRLSGKKETLILRIKEHIDIVNGGGEKKYPASSFVLNCKGDACMGDIVMFEQSVYEAFNIASRSATGPPCGTRVVAGRIVKESYGAAKQQHTFTIEVLWSKGEKPLPPLHPLLIKGRNLYRLKTMRQKWENESERQKMLSEKHTRGGAARVNRETRIKQREMRKVHNSTRTTRAEHLNGNQKVAKSEPLLSAPIILGKLQQDPKNNTTKGAQMHTSTKTCQTDILNVKPNITPTAHYILPESVGQRQPLNGINYSNSQQSIFQHPNFGSSNGLYDGQNYTNYFTARSPVRVPHPSYCYSSNTNYPTQRLPFKENQGCGSMRNSLHGVGNVQKQACRYYAQGKCRFGDRCKYLHE